MAATPIPAGHPIARALRAQRILVPGNRPFDLPTLRNSRFTKHLLAFVNESGGIPAELASGRSVAVYGSRAANHKEYGKGTKFGGTSGDYDTVDNADGAFNISASTRRTFFVDCLLSGNQSAHYNLGGYQLIDAQNKLVIRQNSNSAGSPNTINCYMFLGNSTAAMAVALPNNCLAASGLHHVRYAVSLDCPSQVATAAAMIDGKLYKVVGTPGTGATSGSITAAPTTGQSLPEMTAFNQTMFARAWFDDVFSVDELAALVADPYSKLFKSANSSPYLLPAATSLSAAVNTAAETETALAIGRVKRRMLGVTAEAETARPITGYKRRAIGQAAETDAAQALGAAKHRALSPALETDTANTILISGINIGAAVETDLAMPVTGYKRRAVGTATEADTARALGTAKHRALSPALESDGVITVTGYKRRAVGPAVETDAARALVNPVAVVLPQPGRHVYLAQTGPRAHRADRPLAVHVIE